MRRRIDGVVVDLLDTEQGFGYNLSDNAASLKVDKDARLLVKVDSEGSVGPGAGAAAGAAGGDHGDMRGMLLHPYNPAQHVELKEEPTKW